MRNYEFNEDFNRLVKEAELRSKLESQAPTKMRTFEESKKSQKTVASLKIDKNEKNKETAKNTKKGGSKNKKQEVMEEGNKYLTSNNFEALTVLCSVVKHAGSSRA